MIPLHPPRLAGFDYRGEHRYFLTFCTFYRRPLFNAPERVDLARTQILRSATNERFELTAYCFMPDHLHLLATGSDPTSDCRRFITRAKQFSGYHYQQAFNERLWQRYGYEHVLRSDEKTFRIARYILENPIRAGLVGSVHEYPYLGSRCYTVDQILDALHLSG
jgi:putative transposase